MQWFSQNWIWIVFDRADPHSRPKDRVSGGIVNPEGAGYGVDATNAAHSHHAKGG